MLDAVVEGGGGGLGLGGGGGGGGVLFGGGGELFAGGGGGGRLQVQATQLVARYSDEAIVGSLSGIACKQRHNCRLALQGCMSASEALKCSSGKHLPCRFMFTADRH